MSGKPRLLNRVREAIRLRHYSYRTEQQYVSWIRRYIHFHDLRHPETLGGAEIEAFLTSLATQRNVTAATQAQALAALLFLYRRVLNVALPWLGKVVTVIPDVLRESLRQQLKRVLERHDCAKAAGWPYDYLQAPRISP